MSVSARKRIWGWWFFDWASQPYNTLLLTFCFGPYFAELARDYDSMAEMLFSEPPSLNSILSVIGELEERINRH